jgi:hypothetical protein
LGLEEDFLAWLTGDASSDDAPDAGAAVDQSLTKAESDAASLFSPGKPAGGCEVPCPLAELVVHVNNGAGKPLKGVEVTVLGKGTKITDEHGVADYGKVEPGTYSATGTKSGYSPTAGGAEGPAKGTASVPASSSTMIPLTLYSVKTVLQVKASLPGTKGKRNAANVRPKNTLTPSNSNDESLAANPPVILVRGCNEVELEAVTIPVNQGVAWSVKPNENSESAPTITPKDGGKKATLKTNKGGSFSVIAELGDGKVVWNVVFVWVDVKVKESVTKTQATKYMDAGSSAAWTSFRSGEFRNGEYAWWAWAKHVRFVGGGKSGKLGVGKVHLHILQDGVADTLTGNYAGGGTGVETPPGGLPILDANTWTPAVDKPFLLETYGAVIVKPANSSITDNSTKREIWTGDSPAGAFRTTHPNSGKQIQSISGVNGFTAAVATVSTDAPTAYVVHAKVDWTANFAGNVGFGTPPGPVGAYTRSTANTTSDARFKLISEATGGQDPHVAGMETFAPIFNGNDNGAVGGGGPTTKWTP